MGDNVLESQAEHTKKRRERQRVRQLQTELIVRPEVISVEYTVDCSQGDELKAGDHVHCYAGELGAPIEVVKENHLVGVVQQGGGADLLRESLGSRGIGQFVVHSVCSLTATAKVVSQSEGGT
jgi:hypothetical protein